MGAQRPSNTCPYCGTGMRPVAMECGVCGVEVRGTFRLSVLHQLDAEEMEFLESYLMAGFSIKALAASTGMGYAAIRSRLDRLMARYGELRESETKKKEILEKVASGELAAADAVDQISKIQGGT